MPVITLYSGQVAGIPSISISGIWDLISGLDATTERFCPDQTGSLSVRKGNLVDLPMMDQFVQEEEYCEHIYNMIRYRCTPTHTHTHHLKVKQFCFVFSIKACNIYPTDYVFGVHVFLFPFLEGLPQGAIHALSSKAPLPGGKIGSIGIFS